MASGIVTCDGVQLDVHKKIRHKPSGIVIKVCGAQVMEERARFFNAEECEPVSDDTPTTAELAAAEAKKAVEHGKKSQPISGEGTFESDCVVWGT